MKRHFRPVRRPLQKPVDTVKHVSGALESDLEHLKSVFHSVDEYYVRRIDAPHRKAAIVFMPVMVDKEQLEKHVIIPVAAGLYDHGRIVDTHLAQTSEVTTFDDIIAGILVGKAVLLVDGRQSALILGITRRPERSISPPDRERTVAGPKESFTEDLNINLGLVRASFRTPALKTERFQVGLHAPTAVVLMYSEDTADTSLIDAMRKVVQEYPGEHLTHISVFSELIEDYRWSPFPQTIVTERPDAVVSSLQEGRIALLAEGSPGALIAPVTFVQLFQSPEDYYLRPALATAIRTLRLLAFIITTTAVAAYVAIISYHYDMIPLKLLTQLASNRANIPFTPLTEALILDIGIELLREGGIRLPKPLGQTLGVASALVLGQSALAANIVSPVLVVTVGFTALASFAIPNYSQFLALRLIRFGITIAAGIT